MPLLPIEEYIAQRKKENNINEFNLKEKDTNMSSIVNFVFDYFNHYLDEEMLEEHTVLEIEKATKYRNQLEGYSPQVADWLVSMFLEHNNNLRLIIGNAIKKDDIYLLYSTEAEFRSLSYECYSTLHKRYPYLKFDTEMIFEFIKDFHAIESREDFPIISDSLSRWMENTHKKYGVNVAAFAYDWIDRFTDNNKLWPKSHIIKNPDYKEGHSYPEKYIYNIKAKSNLFNLNSLYRKLPKKPYLNSRKKDFEVLMMYYWVKDFMGDDENYWEEYIQKYLKHEKN